MALVTLREPLKRMAGGRSHHALDGATVADLLRELERAHPAVSGWIVDERGAIRRHVKVFVNGESAGEEKRVASDDRLDVVPAISGG